ncbi:hypothetical protein FA13DRAFT_1725911 [Coprinellus micaceus]|uniref:Uncharacterized protein n=1 Tax=Coprinellus micaceus TaxID=71717 RepID=A0A4Y7TVS8_COPMI|nr:hypothetical protein FA13DRAFT_1725911 [Coprinellus micaceus]
MAPPPIVVSYPSTYWGTSSAPCRDLDECVSRRGGLWLSPTTLWILLALLIVFVLGAIAVYVIRRRRRKAAEKYGLSLKAKYMAMLDHKAPVNVEVAPCYEASNSDSSTTPLTTAVPAVPTPPPSYRPS